jgi:hypothetical protein
MATSINNDLRSQILEYLLQRIRDDRFPSSTMLDMAEKALRDGEELQEYTGILLGKVRDDAYPSMDLMRRLFCFI